MQGEVERRALVVVTDGHKAQAATFGATLDSEENRVAVGRVLRGRHALLGDDGDVWHEHDRFLAPQAKGEQERQLGGDTRISGRNRFDDSLEFDCVAFPASVFLGGIGAFEASGVLDVVRERMHHARLPDPGVGVDAEKAQLLLYVRRAVRTFQHRYTALPTPVGDTRIAGPVVNQHLDMPPGEVVGIDLIPKTTQQGEGAKE